MLISRHREVKLTNVVVATVDRIKSRNLTIRTAESQEEVSPYSSLLKYKDFYMVP